MALGKSILYDSIGAWQSKAIQLFGDDPKKWRFKCPSCGRTQTPEEFHNLKLEPNDAATQCLGRFTGMLNGPEKCDWAAFGLFAGPAIIENDGKKIYAFDFDQPEVKSEAS